MCNVLRYVFCHSRLFETKDKDTPYKKCRCIRVPTIKDLKFEKGERRIRHELDISRLLLMLRSLKVMTRTVYKDRERTMLKIQRDRVLSSDDDDSHEDIRPAKTHRHQIEKDKYDLPFNTDERVKAFEVLRGRIMGYVGEEINDLKDLRLIGGIKSKTLALQNDEEIERERVRQNSIRFESS